MLRFSIVVVAVCLLSVTQSIDAAPPTDWEKVRAEWAKKRAADAKKYGHTTRSTTSSRTSGTRSPHDKEWERKKAEWDRARLANRAKWKQESDAREKQDDAAKAERAKGPSIAELKAAGSPMTAARQFLDAAKAARRPEQVKPYVAGVYWQQLEGDMGRFDPDLAKRELQKIAGKTDSDAELKRRIHTDPRIKFVQRFRRIGEDVLRISKAPRIRETSTRPSSLAMLSLRAPSTASASPTRQLR